MNFAYFADGSILIQFSEEIFIFKKYSFSIPKKISLQKLLPTFIILNINGLEPSALEKLA